MDAGAALPAWAEPVASHSGEGKRVACLVKSRLMRNKGVSSSPALTNSGSAMTSLALTSPRFKESHSPPFHTHNKVYDITIRNLASSWETPNLSSSL